MNKSFRAAESLMPLYSRNFDLGFSLRLLWQEKVGASVRPSARCVPNKDIRLVVPFSSLSFLWFFSLRFVDPTSSTSPPLRACAPSKNRALVVLTINQCLLQFLFALCSYSHTYVLPLVGSSGLNTLSLCVCVSSLRRGSEQHSFFFALGAFFHF